MKLTPETLTGRVVRLEPLTPAHKEELRPALDHDAETWAILASSGQGEHFETWWRDAMEAGPDRIAYAVRRLADGRVVGTSSYLHINEADFAAEVGSTFYEPASRGGTTNPECKLLLFGHAFACGARRMELRVDALNARSQAACAKLGAVREGTLRRHKLTWTGRLRDTVVFSILDDEWPAVRAALEARLRSAAA